MIEYSRASNSNQHMRDQYVDAQINTPKITETSVSQFIVQGDAATQGVDVSFVLTDATGVSSITLVRAGVMDSRQAVVLQSWSATESAFVWSDTDAKLKSLGEAYYWLKLEPKNSTGTELLAGPQYILLNPSLVAPIAALGISASHGAAANGVILVTANVSGIPAGESVKIYVTGYEGNASRVAVAQRASSPMQFALQATGETVTFTAIVVSSGGTEAFSGPSVNLVLNGAATVPAKPQGLVIIQISSGNQVQFPASIELGVTAYQIYRGQRGDLFAAATLLATVTSTGAGTVEYLDTGGLGGDYQYFVIVVSASGNSVPSDPASPPFLFSSSSIPPNVPGNSDNNATITSFDAGTNVTVNIFGPGGVGTGYLRKTGFGSLNRPAGTILGLAYLTTYYILYSAGSYSATIDYEATLPDGYEWVAQILTCPSGGTGVLYVQVLNGGSYTYSTSPTYFPVTFTGGGGSGAAAQLVVLYGVGQGVQLSASGSLYTSAPSATVASGGAILQASISASGGGGSGVAAGNRGAVYRGH